MPPSDEQQATQRQTGQEPGRHIGPWIVLSLAVLLIGAGITGCITDRSSDVGMWVAIVGIFVAVPALGLALRDALKRLAAATWKSLRRINKFASRHERLTVAAGAVAGTLVVLVIVVFVVLAVLRAFNSGRTDPLSRLTEPCPEILEAGDLRSWIQLVYPIVLHGMYVPSALYTTEEWKERPDQWCVNFLDKGQALGEVRLTPLLPAEDNPNARERRECLEGRGTVIFERKDRFKRTTQATVTVSFRPPAPEGTGSEVSSDDNGTGSEVSSDEKLPQCGAVYLTYDIEFEEKKLIVTKVGRLPMWRDLADSCEYAGADYNLAPADYHGQVYERGSPPAIVVELETAAERNNTSPTEGDTPPPETVCLRLDLDESLQGQTSTLVGQDYVMLPSKPSCLDSGRASLSLRNDYAYEGLAVLTFTFEGTDSACKGKSFDIKYARGELHLLLTDIEPREPPR